MGLTPLKDLDLGARFRTFFKKSGRKKIIHVNQHVIKANRKNDDNDPVLTCKFSGETPTYAHEVVFSILGLEIGRVIYRPNKPLSCGAHVWIEMRTGIVDINYIINEKEVDQL